MRPPSREKIVNEALPGVVYVQCNDKNGKTNYSSAGFLASRYGHIITTAHTIEDCNHKKVKIWFKGSNRVHKSLVLKYNRFLDIAILQVPTTPKHIRPLKLDTSLYYDPGDQVILIGHPDGFAWTVMDGVISAERTYDNVRSVQVTTPIIPGTSGGPLLNKNGRVVGMALGYAAINHTLGFTLPGRTIHMLLQQFNNETSIRFR